MNEFYLNQAGSGISPYEGVRFQRGHGFFSTFIKGRLLPILKSVLPYLGKTALEAGLNIAQGVKEGQSFKEASKSTLKRKAFNIAEDGLEQLRKQTGLGFKHQLLDGAQNLVLVENRHKRKKRSGIKAGKKRHKRQEPLTLF